MSHLLSAESARAVKDMKRATPLRKGIPLSKTFVRIETGDSTARPALQKLFSRGRSGDVSIKLYLALIWKCSAAPFDTSAPARFWATVLDLPDPADKGARRVRAALRTLEELKLIEIDHESSRTPRVSLLLEDGSGDKYEQAPSDAYVNQGKTTRNEHMYFKVPVSLWGTGDIQGMSGSALVMLLILLAEQGDDKEVWFTTDNFWDRYRISKNSRAIGTKQLQDMGLLKVAKRPLGPFPGASLSNPLYTRRAYTLTF